MSNHHTHRKKYTYMERCIKYIKNLIVKFLIHHEGIRFYEQNVSDFVAHNNDVSFIGTTTIRTRDLKELKFMFYRKTYKDRIFRKGKVTHQVFIGYGVECLFDDSFPDYLTKYNNLKFVVRQRYLKWAEEKVVLYILMNIFVDFIIEEKNKGVTASKL